MLFDHRIVAFTPCGRKRYMDILAGYMKREHDRGSVDKWLLFNNAYLPEDSTYADQLAAQFDWVEVLRDSTIVHEVSDTSDPFKWSRPENISLFYKFMREPRNTIYLRFDDDIVYVDQFCVPKWVKFRVDNPKPFLVFPTIVNNVRTSYHLQQQGLIPECGVKDDMYDGMAWRNLRFVHSLHNKALGAIESGRLVHEFALKSEDFSARGEAGWEAGHISINAFAIHARDMHACRVAYDEEGYLSLHRPRQLGRQNARVGDAVLIHFAYHTQTAYMDKTGILEDYARLAPPLEFRTRVLSPSIEEVTQAYDKPRRFILGEVIPPRPRFTIRNADGSIKKQVTVSAPRRTAKAKGA